MALIDQSRQVFAKIAGPLLISLTILGIFFFGGEAYQRFGIEFVDSTTAVAKNVLGVIGFLSCAVLANRIIRYVLFEGFIASATGTPVPRLLLQISSLIIYAIATSACARILFNQDLTFLWAASGVAGLVLGMALRELLQDVFAGIALNIDRAVRIGDWIQIHRSGDERTVGQLMEISWRTTRVRDLLGDMVSFPNSKFSAYTISNFSLPEEVSNRRVYVLLDSSVPVDMAFRILQAAALDALLEHVGPGVALPSVAVNGIKPEGVEYMIQFNAQWKYLNSGIRAIYKAVLIHLARAGLRPAGRSIAVTEHPPAAIQAAYQATADHRQAGTLLRQVRVLAGLPETALALLAQQARPVRVAAGRVFIQAGEAVSEFYIVQEGLLETLDPHKLSGQGKGSQVLRPGDCFGEATAFLGMPHRRNIRTRTESLLLEINGFALQQLFEDIPESLDIIAGNLSALGVLGNATDGEDVHLALLRQIVHMFPGVRPLDHLNGGAQAA